MSISNITKWYKWGYYKQGDGLAVIRRYRLVNGKRHWESYPKNKYKNFSQNEIEALIRRLNVSYENEKLEAQKRYEYDHAFINKKVLKDYEEYLTTKANSKEHIRTLISSLHEYTLKHFLKAKLSDPNLWKKNEASFGNYLRRQNISSGYIKRIIQNTNRFLRFLHNTYPDEIRLVELSPLSNQVLKDIESQNKNSRLKFITEENFIFICENIDKSLIPLIKLGYCFGLRRAEILGLKTEDVYEDCLDIKRQLVKITPIPFYKSLKSKEERQVPYWYSTPEEAYSLISQIELINPDTFSDLFRAEMKRLKLPFQLHDFRRTFITMALRKYNYMDVRLAVGHTDLETTNKYIQDDRRLQRKQFKPRKLVSI